MSKTRSFLALLSLLSLGAAVGGCRRQDTECLSSIGRKIMDRAGTATAGCRERLAGMESMRAGTESVQERVAVRLRWEKYLVDTQIEVIVNGHDVELKGTVKWAEQRARAAELAEATTGVERVQLSLTVAE